MMRQLGYKGARRAEAHADRAQPDPLWSKVAWVRFLEFLTRRGRHSLFTSEEFRTFAWQSGLADPPDERAYGNIIRRAAKKHLIVGRYYVTGSNPQAHGRPVRVWEVA